VEAEICKWMIRMPTKIGDMNSLEPGRVGTIIFNGRLGHQSFWQLLVLAVRDFWVGDFWVEDLGMF
jgi:hypothetical protein